MLHQEKLSISSNIKKNGCANESSKASLINKSLTASVTPTTSKTKSTKTAKAKQTSSKPSKLSANINTNSNSSFSYEDENDDNNTTITSTTNTTLTNNQTINENESNSANTINDDYEDDLNYSDLIDSTSNRTLTPLKISLKKEENQYNNENNLISQGQTKSPTKKIKSNTENQSVVVASNVNPMAPSSVALSQSPSQKSTPLKSTNPPTCSSPISKLSIKNSNSSKSLTHENIKAAKSAPNQNQPSTFLPPPPLINESEGAHRASHTKNFSMESINGNSINPNNSLFPFAIPPQLQGHPHSLEALSSLFSSLNQHQNLSLNNNTNGNNNKPSSTNNSNLMPPPLVSAPNEHPHFLMNKLMVCYQLILNIFIFFLTKISKKMIKFLTQIVNLLLFDLLRKIFKCLLILLKEQNHRLIEAFRGTL